jgi:hypothetical protein
VETGLLYEMVKEEMIEMTPSAKILFLKKMSRIYNTLEYIEHERTKDKAKDQKGKKWIQ